MLLGSGLQALWLVFPWQDLQWAAFVPVSSPNCSFQNIFMQCVLIIFTASPSSSHIYPLYPYLPTHPTLSISSFPSV